MRRAGCREIMTAASVATALQQLRGDRATRKGPAAHAPGPCKKKDGNPKGCRQRAVGDLMCNFARCCRPGTTRAHRRLHHPGPRRQHSPPGLRQFPRPESAPPGAQHRSRAGARAESATYPVDLTLRAFDRSGLIRDIRHVCSPTRTPASWTSRATRTRKSMQTVMEHQYRDKVTCRH